jgi:hypothetical protein
MKEEVLECTEVPKHAKMEVVTAGWLRQATEMNKNESQDGVDYCDGSVTSY